MSNPDSVYATEENIARVLRKLVNEAIKFDQMHAIPISTLMEAQRLLERVEPVIQRRHAGK